MKTSHQILFQDSKQMRNLPNDSVDLIVTSPPYPMIEMWDKMFFQKNGRIRDAIEESNVKEAFELMHQELDPVWQECYRVLMEGRCACINIGEALRKINGEFRQYTNHSRILHHLQKLGFTALPGIIWRKPTNAPNKFMGSGTLPANAYVTLEHEYILILRKGRIREFIDFSEKQIRRESSIFWEERNNWYSDVWSDLKGVSQNLAPKETRDRSAAFPFELVYRLINMYSIKGDTVIDPFLGTGTTMVAAMASGRNSIGFEIDPTLAETILDLQNSIINISNEHIHNRLLRHIKFCFERFKEKKPMKYKNNNYGFPVVNKQERDLLINDLIKIDDLGENEFEVSYSEKPQAKFCRDWLSEIENESCGTSILNKIEKDQISQGNRKPYSNQLSLFAD